MLYLVGALLIFMMTVANFAVLATTRYFIARAFGIPDIRFLFGNGPNTSLDGISRWARPAILLSGAAATYALAASPFVAGYYILGDTRSDGTRVTVLDGRPAAEAGMKTGDRVMAIRGQKIERWDELVAIVRVHPGEPLDVTVDREGATLQLTVTPSPDSKGDGKIGVSQKPLHVELGIGETLARGFASPVRVIGEFVKGWTQVMRRGEGDLAGPVAIVKAVEERPRSSAGLTFMVLGALNAYGWPAFVVLCFFLLPRTRKQPPANPPTLANTL